jgi:hypothetical protein
MADLSTKISKTVFSYNLVGFNMNVIYNCRNRSLILADQETGAPLEIVEKDEDLDFEDFVLVARNLLMDLIDSFN